MIRRPPSSPPFPYTTLFRSRPSAQGPRRDPPAKVRAPARHSFRGADDERRDEANGPDPVRAPGVVVYGERGPSPVREPRGTAAAVRPLPGGPRARHRDRDRIYGAGPRAAVPSGRWGRPDGGHGPRRPAPRRR